MHEPLLSYSLISPLHPLLFYTSINSVTKIKKTPTILHVQKSQRPIVCIHNNSPKTLSNLVPEFSCFSPPFLLQPRIYKGTAIVWKSQRCRIDYRVDNTLFLVRYDWFLLVSSTETFLATPRGHRRRTWRQEQRTWRPDILLHSKTEATVILKGIRT